MNSSEHKIIHGNENVIICFGGMALEFGGILPFEFLKYLSAVYKNKCDLIFFIDKQQCWYHKGLQDITHNIEDTVAYINGLIHMGNYKKVLFLGTSAGGYGAILFGSLCSIADGTKNYVISFIPQTIIPQTRMTPSMNFMYKDLKQIINKNTKYCLYGDTGVTDINSVHHISHCDNIECFENVKVIKKKGCNLKLLRDNGFIKGMIDSVLLHK
jgi:hypothetical protein